MKNLYFIIMVIGSILVGCGGGGTNKGQSATNMSNNDQILHNAFENKQNNLQVQGSGTVIKLLPDDTTGSQHQKFILKLLSGQTLLISHNIDLSTRIDTLTVNDTIEFYGEYEWNAKGGLIHWTHDDPKHTHEDGWLKHKGITYQ